MRKKSVSAKAKPPESVPAFGKKAISIRLDVDVLNYFKATGRLWQTRVNAILRAAMGRGKR